MKMKGKYLLLKDKIRIFIFPVLVNILHKLGFSYYKMGNSFFGTSTLIAQGKTIGKKITLNNRKRPINIIFLTMLGGHPHNVSFEIIIAWVLKLRGHNITFILDDLCMPMTEDTTIEKENNWNRIRAISYYWGYQFISKSGFNVIKSSELIDSWKVVKFDKNFESIVEAGLLKHYKVGVISDNLPRIDLKRKLLQESAMISFRIGKQLVNKKPDRIIMSHGIYPTWGPAFEVLNKAGVDVLTYGRGKKANTQKFNWNYTSDWWDVSKEWAKVKDRELNSQQLKKINSYLESRVSHKNDALVYNFGELQNSEDTYDRFELDKNKPVFSLFTNVLWDAASAQREIVFKNPIDWVIETIQWFSKNQDKQLLIKIHPAEVVIGTNQPFINIINDFIFPLPKNVRIIKPEETVNSWSIYRITDLGLVHTTTAGMELPLLGKPCVVVSKTHFRGKGFTIDINSKKEYFEFLDSFEAKNIDKKELETFSKRYAYLLFERYQIPFNFLNEKQSLNTRSLKIEDFEELLEDEYIKLIVDGIENRDEILIYE